MNDIIKEAIALANGSYAEGVKQGYEKGWQEGFRAGLDSAQRVIAGVSNEEIVADLKRPTT